MKKTVYEIAKERILKRLQEAEESGKCFRWVKPWTGGIKYPCSYEHSTPYRGVNAILLDAGEYITRKKIFDLQKKNPDIRLKKDAESFPVFFFSFPEKTEKEDDEKKSKSRPIFRYYRVYHISDVENLESKFSLDLVEHTITAATQLADSCIKDYCQREGIKMKTVVGGMNACYNTSSHCIRLPDKGQFKSLYEYYSTCFHELVHSTGIKLNRDMSGMFGDTKYAREELVAEIGASMLCSWFQIMDDSVLTNNIAYIQGWSSYIKEEKANSIINAASQAQKACDLILNELYAAGVA